MLIEPAAWAISANALTATGEMDVDTFCGAGGTTTGIEAATGQPVAIALNHDQDALAMHRVNHPDALHLRSHVWRAHPGDLRTLAPVRIAWFSPDCVHHSKAKGGRPLTKPAERTSRDLAWIAVAWAKAARPRIIIVENVVEFLDWGPLGADGRPDPKHRGETFRQWLRALRREGYRDIAHRTLAACDYGSPTSRKRLFIIARRDARPVEWPVPTHGPDRPHPHRTAAECIDLGNPGHSIFLTREEGRAAGCRRPLAPKTMARIARGLERFVLGEQAAPFVIPITHAGDHRRGWTLDEPLRTITCANRGEFALVAPRVGFLDRQFTNGRGAALSRPMPTACAGANKSALITLALGPTETTHRPAVEQFLIKYYSDAAQLARIDRPAPTLTTRARLGLVSVASRDYRIEDISLRMLSSRELFTAQGFPPDYRIDTDRNGRRFSKTAQIRLVGNSVCPQVAQAIVATVLATEPRPGRNGRPRPGPDTPWLPDARAG